MAVWMPRRRDLMVGALSLAATSAMAQSGAPAGEAASSATPSTGADQTPAQTSVPPPPSGPRVDMTTGDGLIVLELYPDKAPITAANFLRYVRTRRFDGANFYRALRTPGLQDRGLIQGGLQNDPKKLLPPIAHESTQQTGLRHVDGTISMARGALGTATADFFICAGAVPSLDADLAAPGDNQGFAAFGRVVTGMDVVLKILSSPTDGPARNPIMQGQILTSPVPIMSMRLAA